MDARNFNWFELQGRQGFLAKISACFPNETMRNRPIAKMRWTASYFERRDSCGTENNFFLEQILKGRSFDEDHYVEVKWTVRNHDPQINAERDKDLFLSMYELKCAIEDVPQSDASDNDGTQGSMVKHCGIRMTLRLLKIFNSCWHESTWPWISFRVIFIKNRANQIIHPVPVTEHWLYPVMLENYSKEWQTEDCALIFAS